MGMHDDLRIAPRATVSWRVAMLLEPGKFAQLRMVNISEGGIGLATELNLHLGQQLQLIIETPHLDGSSRWTHIPCRGVVVHSVLSGGIYRIGVKFSEIDANNKAIFKAWVTKLTSPIS